MLFETQDDATLKNESHRHKKSAASSQIARSSLVLIIKQALEWRLTNSVLGRSTELCGAWRYTLLNCCSSKLIRQRFKRVYLHA